MVGRAGEMTDWPTMVVSEIAQMSCSWRLEKKRTFASSPAADGSEILWSPMHLGLRLFRDYRGGFHFHLGAFFDEALDLDHRHRRIMAADDVPVGGADIF